MRKIFVNLILPFLLVTATFNSALAEMQVVNISWSLPADTSDIGHIVVGKQGESGEIIPATATGHTGQYDITNEETIFEVKTVDAAGNETIVSVGLYIDKTPPPAVTNVTVSVQSGG